MMRAGRTSPIKPPISWWKSPNEFQRNITVNRRPPGLSNRSAVPKDYDGYLFSAPSFNGSYIYCSTFYNKIVVNNDLVLTNDTIPEISIENVSQKAVAQHDALITGQQDGYTTE